MKIVGLQKLTLLDFPGKTACTVFTGGCNLRCPFCHNSDLVLHAGQLPEISEEEFFSLLEKRKKTLDGVCITGGEPCLMLDLEDFCRKIKEHGFLVKLDTNGFFPERLRHLIDVGCLDYVAMDIKNRPEKYPETTGIPDLDPSPALRSIELLKSSSLPHEFRTTLCRPLHTPDDPVAIAKLLGPSERYFLQGFKDSGALIGSGMSAFLPSEMKEMLNEVNKFAPLAALRGIDA